MKCLSGAAASAIFLSSCDEPESPNPPTPPPGPLSPRSKAANAFVNAAGMPLLVCVTGTDFEAMLIAGLARLG